jgi:hypothetical protein
MFQIFRPLHRYWITNITCTLFWTAITSYLAFRGIFVCLIWPLYFLGSSLLTLYRLKHTRLKFDEQYLFAQTRRETNQVPWNEILMIRQVQQMWKRKYLELATEQKRFTIPLEYLDMTQIWYWVQRYAPPEALQDDAYKRVPSYQEWLTTAQKLVNAPQEPLRAGYSLGEKIVVGLTFIVITLAYLLILALTSSSVILSFGLIILILGGWFLSSFLYWVEMTSETVASISLWQRQQIDWREIEYIEHDFGEHRFVLYGSDKRLTIPGPRMLAGKDVAAMVEMLKAQVTCREIELRHKERALFTRSRNVTIKAG